MKEDSHVISLALQSIRLARSLERVADHATNIAENVVYIVEGRVLKHSQDKNG